ncbi:MAG TPA: MFS transporter [Candidatus Sulfopaludibacter sp.]|nr:MFS transporter [Candidatus Sulfopaludibacter sp.]
MSAKITANHAEPPPLLRSIVVWSIPAIFYLFAFYLRNSPAVMTSELMRSFGIGAKDLGSLSAYYFYAYVLMQIPTGMLIDSLGPRKLLIVCSISSAMGAFLFGATGSFGLACVGRAITGGATAAAWLVILKLATHWFPSRRFAMVSGLGLAIGNMGALTAQVPLRLLVEHFTWRTVVIASAVAILLVAVLAWGFVCNDPSQRGYLSYAPRQIQGQKKTSLREIGTGLKRIFAFRNIWLIFFTQGGLVGPILAFTGLWGPPFLKARFAVTSTAAAAVCSVMIVCWAAASPIFGALSDKMGRRKPLYVAGCVAAAAGWAAMFYVSSLSLPVFVVLAAIASFASGAVILGFAYGKESVPVQYLGTVSGTINIGNMIGPTLLQPGIGRVLERFWTGGMANGARVYGVEAFQAAFLLSVGWTLLSCVLSSLTRETECRQSQT